MSGLAVLFAEMIRLLSPRPVGEDIILIGWNKLRSEDLKISCGLIRYALA